MTKTLVTGGAGFIGSHLVELLLSKGHSVRVLDNLITGRLDNLSSVQGEANFDFHRVDIADYAAIKDLFTGVDWVFHVAGLADIVPSIQHPLDYHTSNVTGTISVLEASRAAGPGRFVYAASSSCYGIPDQFPTPETSPIRAKHPYAFTKNVGEQYTLHWNEVYKLPAVSLRLFNVYGPRSRTSGAYGAVFGVFLAQKLAGQPFTVVGDGNQTRDFTFVSDVAEAFVKAAESDISGEVFNVGSGNTYSVNHLVELIGGDVVNIPKRPGEPDCTFADCSKIREMLMTSGLYGNLADSGLLVRHEEAGVAPDGKQDAYKILKPELIPFVSYPYEWSFSQLKDAALATLAVQKRALDFGMTLKDATAFNIQFFKGKPVLIDTLSFELYRDGEPWVAYKQFCQHFLAPLASMSYKQVNLGRLSQHDIDGVPLDLASAILPLRTQLIPSTQIHIHLHSRLQRKFGTIFNKGLRRTNKFQLRSFRGLFDSLESPIKRLKWRPGLTEWTDYYYDGESYYQEVLTDKTELISAFLDEVKPNTVWDLGANTGLFSRLASDTGIGTISFDRDPAAVEINYKTAVENEETNLLPQIDGHPLESLTLPLGLVGEIPDIYYIILDSYGRQDELQKNLGHDNSGFLETLTAKGFIIATESRSNYHATEPSLASSLSMRHLDATEDPNILVKQNPLGQLAKKLGYEYVHVNSGWTVTKRNTHADIEYIDESPIWLVINPFAFSLLHHTLADPISVALGADLAFPYERSHASRFIDSMGWLREIPGRDQPTFTFSHNFPPHAPFVFLRDGSLRPNPTEFVSKEDDNRRYVEQLIYVNTTVSSVVDAILENSTRDPIIIIQGDHGPPNTGGGTSADPTDRYILERTAILNAFYLPEHCRSAIYHDITPVNTFRVVLNSCLGTDFELMPDDVYWDRNDPSVDFSSLQPN